VSEIYADFSNYSEINLKNRKKAAEKEVEKWGKDSAAFKGYREEWNRAASEDYLPRIPLHVDIELSDACNLKCKMCVHGLGGMKNVGFMDNDMAKGLISQCADIGVRSIKFNWRGESVINPFLPDAVKFTKEKGILEIQINTNGQAREDIFIKCAENGIDRIIFSVDGFSAETYEEIRTGGKYDRLLGNIHELLKWKLTEKKSRPFVRVQMVRTKINAHEVNDFIKYWNSLVDDVRISDVMDRGQGGSLSVGDQITVGRRRCPQPFQRLVIGRDGRVSPCCADWNQDFVVGDIKKDDLITIWEGKKMEYMREMQRRNEHSKIDICSNCYVKESYVWQKKY